MNRNVPPFESLAEHLTSWIKWRYAASPELLLVISVPEHVPSLIQRWMESALPDAVWRVAWLETGDAVLCGMAQRGNDGFVVVQHHGTHHDAECVYQQHGGGWREKAR
jgi:hypothetical protein